MASSEDIELSSGDIEEQELVVGEVPGRPPLPRNLTARTQYGSGPNPQLSGTSVMPAASSRPRTAYGLTSMPDVAFTTSNNNSNSLGGKTSTAGRKASVSSNMSSDISISFSDESGGRSSPDQEESMSIEFSDVESDSARASDVASLSDTNTTLGQLDSPAGRAKALPLSSRDGVSWAGRAMTGSLPGAFSGGATMLPHPNKLTGPGGTSRLGLMSLASRPSSGSSSATPDISSDNSLDATDHHPLSAAKEAGRRSPVVTQPPLRNQMRTSPGSSGSSGGPVIKLGNMSDLDDMLADDYAPNVNSNTSCGSGRRSRVGSGSGSVTITLSADSSDSDSGSDDDYRPKMLTVEDLEVMSDISASSSHNSPARLTSAHSSVDTSATSSPSSSSATTGRSGSSGEYRPKLLTIDALEAMSLTGSTNGDRSSHASTSLSESSTVSSPSRSAASGSYSNDSSSDHERPRIMAIADLPSIDEIEHAFRGNGSVSQLDSSGSSVSASQGASDKEHHGMNSDAIDGGYVDDLLAGMVMVRQGGDSSSESIDSIGASGLRRSDAELWPIQEADTSHYVTSASHSLSRSHGSSTEDGSEVLGGPLLNWTTSAAGNTGSIAKQQTVEEWAAPYSESSPLVMPRRADYQPLPSITSFSGPAAPQAVFGTQHAQTQPRAIGTQPHQEVDLSPKTNGHCLPAGTRSVCIQVGSMNEVGTQVAYDAARGKLVEGVTAEPRVCPVGLQGLTGCPSQPSRAQRHMTLTAGTASPGPWPGPHAWPAVPQPALTALGSLEHTFVSSLPWHHKTGQQLASTTSVLGGAGLGLLSCAVQNLKAAALLDQLETVSGQIKGIAELAKFAPDASSINSAHEGSAAALAHNKTSPVTTGAGAAASRSLAPKLAVSDVNMDHASPFATTARLQGDLMPGQGWQQPTDGAALSGDTSQAAQTVSDDSYTESFETDASGSQQGYCHKASTCQPSASLPRNDRQTMGLQGRCSSRSLAVSMSGPEKLCGQGGLHAADHSSMSMSSGGPSHHVSMRRQSTVGEQLIPEHNHMDILPRRSTGASRPTTAQAPHKGAASHDGGQHLKNGDVAMPAIRNSAAGASLGSAPVGAREVAASTENVPAHQQHLEAAAKDALLRYHALLSSEAVPGGLLDPSTVARMRTELVAGAVAAAATSGLGLADLLKESSDHCMIKQQVSKLQGQLAATSTTSFGGVSTQPAASIGTGYLNDGRPVMLGRTLFGQPALVDLGGGYTKFRYTTLEDTMHLIRAYKPSSIS